MDAKPKPCNAVVKSGSIGILKCVALAVPGGTKCVCHVRYP